MIRVAVLDDYLHLAEGAVDCATLGVEVDFFQDTIHQTDALVAR